MLVSILGECGFDYAMDGLCLSYNKLTLKNDYDAVLALANKLAHKDGGHNKFLEQIMLWIEVTGTRAWWSQFDTYRVGISKQSESTMHTLKSTELTQYHFGQRIKEDYLEYLNGLRETEKIDKLKGALPESFLQKRIVMLSYKSLRAIYYQRRRHRLQEWRDFLEQTLSQAQYPQWIDKDYGQGNQEN